MTVQARQIHETTNVTEEIFGMIPRITIQIFAETTEFMNTIQALTQDRHMSRTHVKLHSGGIQAALEFYANASTPDVIILESLSQPSKFEVELENLSRVCDAGTKVVVVGTVNDVIFYRDMIRRGLSDYLVSPVETKDLVRTLASLYPTDSAKPMGKSIAFLSARGGLGSSTFAHNIAWSISHELNHAVLIADLDLSFGTSALDFNHDPIQGMADAIAATDKVDQTLIDRLITNCSQNLHMLAAPAILDKSFDLQDSQVEPIIELMKTTSPYVILDLPHTWTNWVRQCVVRADQIVIVTAPDLASMRNTKNLLDVIRLNRPNDVAPLIVLNQVGIPKRPEIKADEFAKALGISFTAIVPFEPAIFGQASNNGQMVGELQPKGAIASIFRQLALQIAGKANLNPNNGSSRKKLLSFLLSKES